MKKIVKKMNKLLLLNGSPRKLGNTSTMIDMLVDNLVEERISTDKVFIAGLDISPCIDCRGCKKGEMTCVLTDDMQTLYDKIDEADYLLFGTPIYWFGPTAQMKIVIDRLRPYYGNKKLTGKKAALLLPAGSGAGDCDLTIEMFKRIFSALGVELIGSVTAQAFDVGDVNSDSMTLASISDLANKFYDNRILFK